MSWRVISAAFLGYCVGNLPDHSTPWLAVKLAFTVAAFALMVRAARREATS